MDRFPSPPVHRASEYHRPDSRNHAYPTGLPSAHPHRNPQEAHAVLGLLSLSPKMKTSSISLPPIRSLDQPPSHPSDGVLLPPITTRRGYYRPEMDLFDNQTERVSRSVPPMSVSSPGQHNTQTGQKQQHPAARVS